jgi:hypothetical protein
MQFLCWLGDGPVHYCTGHHAAFRFLPAMACPAVRLSHRAGAPERS